MTVCSVSLQVKVEVEMHDRAGSVDRAALIEKSGAGGQPSSKDRTIVIDVPVCEGLILWGGWGGDERIKGKGGPL